MRWRSRIGAAVLVATLTGSAQAAQQAGANPAAAPYPGGEAPTAPHGSSQAQPGEERHEAIGYAVADDALAGEGGNAESAAIPAGAFAEVTSLADGRTILVTIVGAGAKDDDAIIALSPAAAAALGMNPDMRQAVRVRAVPATPQDAAALRAGTVAPRMAAPELLIKALRKRLAGAPPPDGPGAALPAASAPPPAAPRPTAAGTGAYYVQVAALSHEVRARAIAAELGGYVKAGGGLYRIRVGGFADRSAAQQKRAEIARRGYGDARIYRTD